MVLDKYSALWVSHTSSSDFLACPRSYYLKNIYKDPRTNHKIKLVSPPLALGQAVHEVIESLSVLPVEDRFKDSLIEKFAFVWKKVSGEKGGFPNLEIEKQYKDRGEEMLNRVMKNPGPLLNKAVKIKAQGNLPYFWLSEKDNIILCGKIDWLEYLEDSDSVHIIDFKTSKHDEEDGSMQLPIYYLLVKNCQNRYVKKASYWYLNRSNAPQEKTLPDYDTAYAKIMETAKKMKLAKQLNVFKCPHKTGCSHCKPYEEIVKGNAQFVGVNEFRQDIYVLNDPKKTNSVIL